MSQTLLALAALFAFSIYALTQHTAKTGVEARLIRGELEQVAAALARSALLDATRHAYDEADVARTDLRDTPAGLTGPLDLGPDADEASPEAFDDIDDFDGLAEVRVGTWDEGPVRFSVVVAVRYVEPTAPSVTASSATLAKEVTVTVAEERSSSGRPPAVCMLRHVVTPAWKHFHG